MNYEDIRTEKELLSLKVTTTSTGELTREQSHEQAGRVGCLVEHAAKAKPMTPEARADLFGLLWAAHVGAQKGGFEGPWPYAAPVAFMGTQIALSHERASAEHIASCHEVNKIAKRYWDLKRKHDKAKKAA